jgi:hypothetical protein
MPPKKKSTKKITVVRAKGTDVSFPKEDNPPDFLIAKMLLTGTTGGAGKEGSAIEFKGEINDITSDQSLLGRPTKFELSGANEGKKLGVNGILDHRVEAAQDSFTFSYEGLTAAEMGLPRSEYLPSFERGTGKINGGLALNGDELDASIVISISNFQVQPAGADELQNITASLWQGVGEITVTARLTGKMDNVSMSVSSNIDKLLADRLSKLYGEKVAEAQDKIKAEVDRLTNDKKAEITAQYAAKKEEIMQGISGRQKEVQDKINELNQLKSSREAEINGVVGGAKKQAQQAVDAQKKAAEDKALAEQQKAQAAMEAEKAKAQAQADEEKRKAEEEARKKAEAEVQKKAQEQLKGLFGK